MFALYPPRQSALAAACARMPPPSDTSEDAEPWLYANGELLEGMLLRGHVLDMLGFQDEPRHLQAEPSAQPAAWLLGKESCVPCSDASSNLVDGTLLFMCL